MELLGVIAAIVIAVIAWKRYQIRQWRQYLRQKYNDESIVEAIMRKTIWQGMSQDQLLDSWGYPAAKDRKVYKTKTAETFKYNQTGKNRFGSRVQIENGIVVGWSQK